MGLDRGHIKKSRENKQTKMMDPPAMELKTKAKVHLEVALAFSYSFCSMYVLVSFFYKSFGDWTALDYNGSSVLDVLLGSLRIQAPP